MISYVKNFCKNLLKKTIYQPGTTVSILKGPLKGYRYVVNDNSGWASIYGGWEPSAQEIYHQLLKKGQVVYDLGANTGIHSAIFAKLVGIKGKVFAFEPLKDNIKELKSIKDLNHIDNIHIIDKAISNKTGVTSLKIGNHNKQGSLVGIGCETGDEIKIEMTTIDNLIEDGLDLPDFIKIDIEGAESDALQGFTNSINKSYPSFAIDLHTPEQDIKVGKFFKEYGYKLYRLHNQLSQKLTKQNELLAEIPNLDAGWPDPNGVWGTIIAVHPSRQDQVISGSQ
ncbi:MAG: FkbM family methyltransferase [Aulosira sp. DedQUE10]|nr:FkbM family methyltransferase [Aulosira sp. DedQUE10]